MRVSFRAPFPATDTTIPEGCGTIGLRRRVEIMLKVVIISNPTDEGSGTVTIWNDQDTIDGDVALNVGRPI